jgi:hypothetical protein
MEQRVDSIVQQCEQLELHWKRVYETAKDNPAAIQPHLPGIAPEQLNEVVKTIGYWLKRVRAPTGFAPGFHVAKGVAATSLAAAVTSSQALARGEYAHFATFVVALNQMLSALHSMLVFSDKTVVRDALAELGGKLSEGLALLDTAQGELESKTALLQTAESSLTTVTSAAASVNELNTKAANALAQIEEQGEAAVEAVEKIKASIEEASSMKARFEALVGENEKLSESLSAQAEEVTKLTEGARKQEELISALLPKGASTGLAAAFGARVGQLERTKWIWMLVFIVSIVSLAGVAGMVLSVKPATTEELWRQILHRLPLAAPFIWLGWFSAIQYGNTLRVQEDYAFKEATSKAFAGYRDHLEHMSTVSLKEGETAMTLLAANTVEILSREPLRIFGDTEKDASPSHSLLDFLRPGRQASSRQTQNGEK